MSDLQQRLKYALKAAELIRAHGHCPEAHRAINKARYHPAGEKSPLAAALDDLSLSSEYRDALGDLLTLLGRLEREEDLPLSVAATRLDELVKRLSSDGAQTIEAATKGSRPHSAAGGQEAPYFPSKYDSDLHRLWLWGERIEARLDDPLDLGRWEKAFRPDRELLCALRSLKNSHAGVITRVESDLQRSEAFFRIFTEAIESSRRLPREVIRPARESFINSLRSLADGISTAAQAIAKDQGIKLKARPICAKTQFPAVAQTERSTHSRGELHTTTIQQEHSIPNSGKQPCAEFGDLPRWVDGNLKGKQRRVMVLLMDNGGHLSLADLGSDPEINWTAPYDDPWNSIQGELNRKLRTKRWRISRYDNKAWLSKIGQK